MKIVLLGYMGSGKTTVGKQLAEKLSVKFLDLDDYIEVELQSTIPQIFQEKGEIFFRKEEHRLLKQVLDKEEPIVLATGGGTPCYSNNMQLINEKTPYSVYLKVTIPELVTRLHKEKDHRPLIHHLKDEELPEFIGKHLFERSPFYSMASHTVLSGSKDPGTLVLEIAELLV